MKHNLTSLNFSYNSLSYSKYGTQDRKDIQIFVECMIF